VERTPQSSSRTVLRAAFARYQGIDGDSVLRLLGSGSTAELGACSRGVDPLAADEADVELIDVGALHIAVADTEARLTPRTFPDLASVLAGVFYAGDAALAMPRPESDEYRFSAEGSDAVGPFEVVVPAPAEPNGLTLVGDDGTAALLDGRVAEVRRDGALTVQWDAEDPRDSIEIELSAAGETLSCLTRDEGSFRIARSMVEALPADQAARLSVRRVRVSAFDVPGIDVAYTRVTAVRSAPLSLR